MSDLPRCIAVTEDGDLLARLDACLRERVALHPVEHVRELERLLEHAGPSLLIADLRAGSCREALPGLLERWPLVTAIVLGEPRSDPWLEAEHLRVYAFEGLNADAERLQALVGRALDHVGLVRENELLRDELCRAAPMAAPPPAGRAERSESAMALRHFLRAFRHFERVDVMLEAVVEGLAAAAMVTRVGVFVRGRDTDTFRLRAGLRCLSDVRSLSYREGDALPRWLETHAHLVARAHLEHLADAGARVMLRRTLDLLGAEVILPLHARGHILGWLFVGHRVTGLPFTLDDLEDLHLAAENVSTLLENALLHEEVTPQKSLAETLLHSLPVGVAACDAGGIVRWFSTAASRVLDLKAERVIGREVETLGSRLSDAMRRVLDGAAPEAPETWFDHPTGRRLSVEVRRLADRETCLGAVALIEDVTAQAQLEEKQRDLERARFWTEMAASMSHEIRNPLVAIRTFAELLPQRYNDPEFRKEFSGLVFEEVGRLTRIIDQINDFAHPPKLAFNAVDVRRPVADAIRALSGLADGASVTVRTEFADDAPPARADEQALRQCVEHLIRNAVESVPAGRPGAIAVSTRKTTNRSGQPCVALTVQDNGQGIPAEIRDKVFSPFCTSKTQGMGLGLPIVRRTVVDHDGTMELDSNAQGTRVTLTLPAANGHHDA